MALGRADRRRPQAAGRDPRHAAAHLHVLGAGREPRHGPRLGLQASLTRTISYYRPGMAAQAGRGARRPRRLGAPGLAAGAAAATATWPGIACTATGGRGPDRGTRTARPGTSSRAQEYSFYVRAVDTNGIQGPRSRIVTSRRPRRPLTTGNATAFILESDGASFADLQRHYMRIGTIFPTYFNCTPSGGIIGVDDPLVTGGRGARHQRRAALQLPEPGRAQVAILTNYDGPAARDRQSREPDADVRLPGHQHRLRVEQRVPPTATRSRTSPPTSRPRCTPRARSSRSRSRRRTTTSSPAGPGSTTIARSRRSQTRSSSWTGASRGRRARPGGLDPMPWFSERARVRATRCP